MPYHPTPLNKLPTHNHPLVNFTLLSVSSDEDDRHSLQRILGSDGWTVQGARSVREATGFLAEQPNLVLCDRDLPDGSWKDVFRLASKLECAPAIVVASRQADESFWAEVLNFGGFDVLLKPFVRGEVSRVLPMARRHPLSLEPAFSC
jgi:DNA-binding response OmpR family regulator